MEGHTTTPYRAFPPTYRSPYPTNDTYLKWLNDSCEGFFWTIGIQGHALIAWCHQHDCIHAIGNEPQAPPITEVLSHKWCRRFGSSQRKS